MANVNSYWFHKTVSRMREFFVSKGFIEVHPHVRQSFLAVADDVKTIATYHCNGENFLLPQTAHASLEMELLKNPELPGVFCCSTSYRQHENPVPGRHENIFPIFDFETHGGIEAMILLKKELLQYLGFNPEYFVDYLYSDVTMDMAVKRIDSATEARLGKERSPVVFVNNKPEDLNPTWVSKRSNGVAKTSDAVLFGMGTIGSIERGTSAERMRERFYTINGGQFSETLFDAFGQARVERELGEFLSLDFFPRSCASIGLTRMVRALRILETEQRTGEAVMTNDPLAHLQYDLEKALS